MIVVIDNYDSFTYNLVQYVGELGCESVVFLNDQISLKQLDELPATHLIISPGPCTPLEAGMSNDIIKEYQDMLPILGVCLGHQCIAHSFGGKVIRAERLMHGKTSMIHYSPNELFKDIPNPFEATRYHSLIVEKKTLPDCFDIIAHTDQDEIMGIKHKEKQIWGLQIHPESILTKCGKDILRNFLNVKV